MQKVLLYSFLGILCASMLLTSCKHDADVANVSDSCSVDTVYFINQVQPFFKANCASGPCHNFANAPEGIVLSSYYTLTENNELINLNSPMESEVYRIMSNMESEHPVTFDFSEDEKNMILEWINQGALNNACRGDVLIPDTIPSDTNTSDTCGIIEPSYTTDIWPTLETNCTGCHGSVSPQAGISITNYTEVKAIADNGYLIGVIDHELGYSPMPQGLPKLDSCYINSVRNWISNGTPDN